MAHTVEAINHYPADSVVWYVNTYPLERGLSGRWFYPGFERGVCLLFSKLEQQQQHGRTDEVEQNIVSVAIGSFKVEADNRSSRH